MQIHNTHIAWVITTFAYCNKCLNISLTRNFTANLLRLSQSLYFLNPKELNKFLQDSNSNLTRKNKNVELELVKQAKLELDLKLDIKIDRVRSPGTNCRPHYFNMSHTSGTPRNNGSDSFG